jgi:hypothetical protein
MGVIPYEVFFLLIIHPDKVRDQPSRIVDIPVEIGQFEVPVRYLKKMEFNGAGGDEFQVPLLKLLQED